MTTNNTSCKHLIKANREDSGNISVQLLGFNQAEKFYGQTVESAVGALVVANPLVFSVKIQSDTIQINPSATKDKDDEEYNILTDTVLNVVKKIKFSNQRAFKSIERLLDAENKLDETLETFLKTRNPNNVSGLGKKVHKEFLRGLEDIGVPNLCGYKFFNSLVYQYKLEFKAVNGTLLE